MVLRQHLIVFYSLLIFTCYFLSHFASHFLHNIRCLAVLCLCFVFFLLFIPYVLFLYHFPPRFLQYLHLMSVNVLSVSVMFLFCIFLSFYPLLTVSRVFSPVYSSSFTSYAMYFSSHFLLLMTTCFAQVEAVSDSRERFNLGGSQEVQRHAVEHNLKEEFSLSRNFLTSHYHDRWGVNLGHTPILVYATPMTGRK